MGDQCLFPKIFDKEVVDISMFGKYIDISSIITQDYNRSNAIWNALKKYTFDPDTIQFVIRQEILISGLINSFMRDRFGTEMHIGWMFSLVWSYMDFAFDEAALATSRAWSVQF